MKNDIFPYDLKNIHPSIKYLGVTSFLDSFEEPFNALEIATKVSNIPSSEYYGFDVELIIKHWKNTGIRGNKKHKEIEDWLKFNMVSDVCLDLKENLGISPDNSFSEIKIYSNELHLNGFIDIVQKNKETIFVHDIKTFSKISDDKIDKASKQIFLYCKMLRENIPDKNIRIKPGKIIIIRPKAKVTDKVDYLEFHEPEYINVNKNVIEYLKKMINVRLEDIKK